MVKKATCIMWEDLYKSDYRYALDVAQVAHVHDEYQLMVRDSEELINNVGNIAVNAFTKAGEHFKLNCPLAGEWKVGNNWAETH